MGDETVRRDGMYRTALPGIGRLRFLVIQNDTPNTHLDKIIVPTISQKREKTSVWGSKCRQ